MDGIVCASIAQVMVASFCA